MMALIQVFVFASMVFCTAYSLTCYKCDSEKPGGCAKSAKPATSPCGTPPADFTFVCYYKSARNTARSISFANSSCVAVPAGSKPSSEMVADCKSPPPEIRVDECRVCDTDLCNAAPLLESSLTAIICLVSAKWLTSFALL
ncbi:uncharacterized protein LOC116179283 [Photinus pyralis]|nr:uncharacterized protein LOC116179283 [Photinus pyralis]